MHPEFVKGLLYIIGINVLINILPSPWGLIVFLGFAAHGLYRLWQYSNTLK